MASYQSIDLYLSDLDKNKHLLYRSIIIGALAISMSAPFVRIDLFTRVSGLVRPSLENLDVHAPAEGFVSLIKVEEGQQVTEGQIILTIDLIGADKRSRLNQAQMVELNGYIHDLRVLLKPSSSEPEVSLTTTKYRFSYERFESEIRIAQAGQMRARQDFDRARALFERNLISQKDLDVAQTVIEEGYSEELRLRQDYRRTWLQELEDYSRALHDQRIYQAELKSKELLGTIRAPASGTIEALANLSEGSFVSSGEVIASIAPQSKLVGELLLTPFQISGVRLGAPVRFRMNSIDYQEWGQLSGTVIEISPDVIIVNQEPVFRVETSLEQTPRSAGQQTRSLKKGMSLEAHLRVSRRTILQILMDRIHNRRIPEAG